MPKQTRKSSSSFFRVNFKFFVLSGSTSLLVCCLIHRCFKIRKLRDFRVELSGNSRQYGFTFLPLNILQIGYLRNTFFGRKLLCIDLRTVSNISIHFEGTKLFNEPGTAQVGAPLKVQTSKVFYICRSTPLLKFHRIHSAKLYTKGYA